MSGRLGPSIECRIGGDLSRSYRNAGRGGISGLPRVGQTQSQGSDRGAPIIEIQSLVDERWDNPAAFDPCQESAAMRLRSHTPEDPVPGPSLSTSNSNVHAPDRADRTPPARCAGDAYNREARESLRVSGKPH